MYDVILSLCVQLLLEIRTTVHRQEIPIMDAADAGIPTAAAADRTQTADTLEIFFQHGGIVMEVLTVSASALSGCFLFTKMHPPGQIHDERRYETHRATMRD